MSGKSFYVMEHMILVASYWNLNIARVILHFAVGKILVAPYWNLNNNKVTCLNSILLILVASY